MQLLSRFCIVCGFFSGREILCAHCAEQLRLSRLELRFSNFCGCGMPVIGSSSCTDCAGNSGSALIIGHHSCFLYCGIVRELMHAYKFQGFRQIAGLFAAALSELTGHFDNPCIVPVPGHPVNVRRRGWDQMEAVIRQPVLDSVPAFRLLRHSSRARNQKVLRRQQRFGNSQRIFSIDRHEMRAFTRSEENGMSRSIFLVDDIRSTGATLSAAADLLSGFSISVCGTISLAMH